MSCMREITTDVCLRLDIDVLGDGGIVSQTVACNTCGEEAVIDPESGHLIVTVPFTATGTLTVEDNLAVNFVLGSIVITEPGQ